MPITITNREEKGSPLTMQEMDNDILERMVDFMNALEMLMSISLNADGTLKNPGFFSGASTNGTDAYTATVPGITTQAGLLGKLLILKCDVANAGPATLNVNGYGAFPIMRFQDQALESDYIKANRYIFLTWDGSNYMMQSTAGVVPPMNYGLDTGAVNALVIAKTGYIAIPATLYPGYSIYVKAANTNTGASTLTLGALPPAAIKRVSGVDVYPGDITTGRVFEVIYDGTNFTMTGTSGAKIMVPFTDGSTLAARANSVLSTPHLLGGKPDIVRVVLLCVGGDAVSGYADTAEISIESAQQNDGDAAFVVSVDATTVYVVARPEAGDYKIPKADGSASVILDPPKWRVKIYAARL